MIRTAEQQRPVLAPSVSSLPSPASLFARLRLMLQVAAERRQLARLDSSRLRDLGLSADAADREAERPFWDAPESWRARLR